MILGLGTDLVAVARVRTALQRHGERFSERILTAGEQDVCAGRSDPPLCVAARFAAKEAAAKALGTGFRLGVRLRDLEVVRDSGRPPRLRVHGEAAPDFGVEVQPGVAARHLAAQQHMADLLRLDLFIHGRVIAVDHVALIIAPRDPSAIWATPSPCGFVPGQDGPSPSLGHTAPVRGKCPATGCSR